MKILHTSDWHLGQLFKQRSREEEHKRFLSWLEDIINQNSIDVLIVSGDIFDTQNPPKYALKMYHNFLVSITKSCCNDVVIIAGNHDSVATLEITKDFLKLLNIHIIADGANIDEAIIQIKKENTLEAIICAVPYLRDSILRDANTTKDNKELENEYQEGIKNYYKNIYKKAKSISSSVPLIATGHFTTTGSHFNKESERELYIGKLASVNSNILDSFDYVAMGHLHSAQIIDKKEYLRYSGSPIPLSFSEIDDTKEVVIVEFDGGKKDIKTIQIPRFKELYRLSGDFETIKNKIKDIKDIDNKPFVDIELEGDILDIDIKDFQQTAYKDGVDIISIRKKIEIENRVYIDEESIKLEDLDTISVFTKRLELETLSQELKEKLMYEYKNILEEINNEDK